MRRGLFFAFEGIDGCGKSTQVSKIENKLSAMGYSVVVTREPGGTPISEKIRSILISTDHTEMVNECELLLYLAARAQHVKEKIVPALENGMVVLCDRFQLATFAYQGYGRCYSLDELKSLNRFATGSISPDMTFVFDIPVDLAYHRMQKMNKLKDRLELTGPDFFKRIRNGYLELGSKDLQHISIIDADQPIDSINATVIKKIEQIISDQIKNM